MLSWCFEPDPQGQHGMIFSELVLATVAMAYIYFESAAHSAPAPMRKCALALVHIWNLRLSSPKRTFRERQSWCGAHLLSFE